MRSTKMTVNLKKEGFRQLVLPPATAAFCH